MSRIGKDPVVVPANVTTQANGQDVSVKGLEGEPPASIPAPITVELKDNKIVINRPGDRHKSRSPHDLSHSLINNTVVGMTEDYAIKTEIFGVGYRIAKKGKDLKFSLGYSHPILIEILKGITSDVDGTAKLSITDIDKQQIGQLAANIRHLRESDSYKGKSIRYDGEQIHCKTGKTGR